jgi:protein-S-isoprenylcysteine O-methyltransferase Ste14
MTSVRGRIINFIYKKATLQGKHHGRLTFLAGALFFGAVLFIIFLAFLSDKLLGLREWPPTPVNLVLSIPLLALGIWLWLWSALIFFHSRGTPVPLSPPPELIETGPYAHSRNLMLSGLFLILFGIGFLFQSLSLIVIFTPLFIVITFLEFKLIEEPELEKRFGVSYLEYKKKVPMFFPYPGHDKRWEYSGDTILVIFCKDCVGQIFT